MIFPSTGVHAQMSQRARQTRERRACEQDLPECRPEIRIQLEAERRRLGFGLMGLAVGVLITGYFLRRRLRSIQRNEREDLKKLHSRLDKSGGVLEQDQAKSDST